MSAANAARSREPPTSTKIETRRARVRARLTLRERELRDAVALVGVLATEISIGYPTPGVLRKERANDRKQRKRGRERAQRGRKSMRGMDLPGRRAAGRHRGTETQ